MSVEEDLTVDAATGEVLLGGELLRYSSFRDLMDAAIFMCIDVDNVKNAIGCKRSITAYFMHRLCDGLSLTMSRWRPPKRAKVETPPKNQHVSVLRRESPVSPLEDSV